MNEDAQADDSIENLLQDAPSQSFQEGTTSQMPRLTSTDAFTLLVSIQIGSGIFTSPGHVDRNVASPCLALLAWLTGGLLAWTGAASFAELGAALPSSGGMQEYLRYVYGDMVASSMALTWIFIVKPTAMAILSLLFVESLAASFEDATPDFSSTWIQRLASIAALLTVVFLNSISTVFTTRMSKSFVVLKFITVGFILLGGLVVFSRHILFGVATPPNNTDWFTKSWIHAREDEPEWSEISTWEALGLFCAAIFGCLWAYSGWDNVRNYPYGCSLRDAFLF
jgi:solute carrier family 7 (L-type amino acid transporter), member 9/15